MVRGRLQPAEALITGGDAHLRRPRAAIPMNGTSGPAELDALRLSLEVAARSVGFSLPLAVLVAWILTRARFPGRMLFDAFVHLPLVLPPVAVGYVLLVLFGARGPLGAWLRGHFGIELAFTTAGAALATAAGCGSYSTWSASSP